MILEGVVFLAFYGEVENSYVVFEGWGGVLCRLLLGVRSLQSSHV